MLAITYRANSSTITHDIVESSWKDKPLEIADKTADCQAPGAAWGICSSGMAISKVEIARTARNGEVGYADAGAGDYS
jgi:hypothetical protein